jgi:hypothetical protein
MFEQRKWHSDHTKKSDHQNDSKPKPTDQKKSTISGAFTGQRTKAQTAGDQELKCLICSKEGHKAKTCFKITKLNNPNKKRKFLAEKKNLHMQELHERGSHDS